MPGKRPARPKTRNAPGDDLRALAERLRSALEHGQRLIEEGERLQREVEAFEAEALELLADLRAARDRMGQRDR